MSKSTNSGQATDEQISFLENLQIKIQRKRLEAKELNENSQEAINMDEYVAKYLDEEQFLIEATSLKSIDAVKLLLELGANPNIVEENKNGLSYTPLHYAVIKVSSDLVNMLISYGASAKQNNVSQTAPRQIADKIKSDPTITNKDKEIINQIIEDLRKAEDEEHLEYFKETILNIKNRSFKAKNTPDEEELSEENLVALLIDTLNQKKSIITYVSNGYIQTVRYLAQLGIDLQVRDADGANLVFTAIAYRQLEILDLLHKEFGLDLNSESKNPGTLTPLILASHLGYIDAVNYLIKNNADLNLTEVSNNTALHAAINRMNLSVVRILLQAPGIDLTIRNNNTHTPLDLAKAKLKHHAQTSQQRKLFNKIISELEKAHLRDPETETGFLEKIKSEVAKREALINKLNETRENKIDVKQDIVNFLNKQKYLLKATESNFTKAVRYLIPKGVDLDAGESEYGNSALHLAVLSDNLQAVQLLLDAGANPDVYNKDKINPFKVKLETMQQLKMRGLSVTQPNQKAILELLRDSMDKAFLKEARKFIEIYKDEYLNSNTDVKESLSEKEYVAVSLTDGSFMSHAIKNCCVDTIRFLHNEYGIGCNLSGRGVQENEVIYSIAKPLISESIQYDDAKVMDFVVRELKVDVDRKYATNQESALLTAASYGSAAVVTSLLRNGANPNSTNKNNNTALHLAASYNNVEIVKSLLTGSDEIDFTLKNDAGYTAMQIAQINYDKSPALTLEKAMAKSMLDRMKEKKSEQDLKKVQRDNLQQQEQKQDLESEITNWDILNFIEKSNIEELMKLEGILSSQKSLELIKELVSSSPDLINKSKDCVSYLLSKINDSNDISGLINLSEKHLNAPLLEITLQNKSDLDINKTKKGSTILERMVLKKFNISSQKQSSLNNSNLGEINQIISVLINHNAQIIIKESSISNKKWLQDESILQALQQRPNVLFIEDDLGNKIDFFELQLRDNALNEAILASQKREERENHLTDSDLLKVESEAEQSMQKALDDSISFSKARALREEQRVADLNLQEEQSAIKIQSTFRGFKTRKELQEVQELNKLQDEIIVDPDEIEFELVDRNPYAAPILDKNGHNPVHLAVLNNNMDQLQEAIDAGHDFSIRDYLKGATPLHLAAANNNVKAVEILLDSGANIYALDNDRANPFSITTNNEIKTILQNQFNKEQEFLTQVANGDIDSVSNYANDFSLSAKNATFNGSSALHIAAQNGCTDILELLFNDYGFNNLNIRDYNGNTPLHLASNENRREAAKFLIQNGCNKQSRNNQGEQAIDRAISINNKAMIEILRGRVLETDESKQAEIPSASPSYANEERFNSQSSQGVDNSHKQR